MRRPLVAKAGPGRQADQKKLQAWGHNPTVDLWFRDEVHFGQHGSRCRRWVPWEEADPVVGHYPGRKSVGYWGAVRGRDGKSLFRKEPEMFNGETFRAFLRQLETAGQENGRRVVVIADHSRCHHAERHAARRLELVNDDLFPTACWSP